MCGGSSGDGEAVELLLLGGKREMGSLPYGTEPKGTGTASKSAIGMMRGLRQAAGSAWKPAGMLPTGRPFTQHP